MIALQQNIAEIQEKIANAPDNGYVIGILIGSLLPFAVLVAWGIFCILIIKIKTILNKNVSTRNYFGDPFG